MYDYSTKTGTVFVGVHDPFIGNDVDVAKEYVFCKNICSELTWLKIDNTRVERGYMFCCDLQEFLTVTGLENMFENSQ